MILYPVSSNGCGVLKTKCNKTKRVYTFDMMGRLSLSQNNRCNDRSSTTRRFAL